jgi:large subunit ribosomal protein L35
MPKMKTRSAAKKRFTKKKSGVIKRAKAYRRHLMTKKSTKQNRQSCGAAYVHESDMNRVLRMLPY